MTTSLEPWSLGTCGQVLSADGKVIAVFNDWLDATRCIELKQQLKAAEERIEKLLNEMEQHGLDLDLVT